MSVQHATEVLQAHWKPCCGFLSPMRAVLACGGLKLYMGFPSAGSSCSSVGVVKNEWYHEVQPKFPFKLQLTWPMC
jgi:hypothetical protein